MVQKVFLLAGHSLKEEEKKSVSDSLRKWTCQETQEGSHGPATFLQRLQVQEQMVFMGKQVSSVLLLRFGILWPPRGMRGPLWTCEAENRVILVFPENF